MARWTKLCGLVVGSLVGLAIGGCSSDGRPSLFPNPDPNLQKSSAQLAADAAKRQYENDAPRAGVAQARAMYELMQRRIDLVNLSPDDWQNVEVWVNHTYVVFIPSMQHEVDKKLNFEMFYDRDGHHFDTHNGQNPLKDLEICTDGKMYEVTAVLD